MKNRSEKRHSRDHKKLQKRLEAAIFQGALVFPIMQEAAMTARWALVALAAC